MLSIIFITLLAVALLHVFCPSCVASVRPYKPASKLAKGETRTEKRNRIMAMSASYKWRLSAVAMLSPVSVNVLL